MITKENMIKCAEGDMELFVPLPKEYSCLKKYEQTVFEQFRMHYELLVRLVIEGYGGKLYISSLVLNGAILRSLNIYRGAIWSLGQQNPHVFFDCLRSQCETLALINYCNENPDYLKAATTGERNHKEAELKIVNILTMIDKVDRKHNGLRKDYDSLCELVHPNPASLYAHIKPLEETGGTLKIHVSTKADRIDDKDAETNLNLLIAWTNWLFDDLILLHKLFLTL